MKYFFIFITFVSFSLQAEVCGNYRLGGFVFYQEDNLFLVVAKGSKSEKSLHIPYEMELQFAPYIKRYVYGNFLLKGSLMSGSVIVAAHDLKVKVPDFLNQAEDIGTQALEIKPCSNL